MNKQIKELTEILYLFTTLFFIAVLTEIKQNITGFNAKKKQELN